MSVSSLGIATVWSLLKYKLSLLSCICFDIYLVELVEKLTKVVLNVAGVVITGILVLVCVDC